MLVMAPVVKRQSTKARRRVSDAEASLFESAMADVMRTPSVLEPPSVPPAARAKRPCDPQTPTPEAVKSGAVKSEPVKASKPKGPVVEVRKRSLSPQPARPDRRGAASGIDRRTAQRLVRGQMRVEDRIDLHGMTQEEARRALDRFLTSAASDGKRCVLVITGKGSARTDDAGIMPDREIGILRRSLPRWLALPDLRDLVVAYHNAKPKDGGEGAFYVLLRRRRD